MSCPRCHDMGVFWDKPLGGVCYSLCSCPEGPLAWKRFIADLRVELWKHTNPDVTHRVSLYDIYSLGAPTSKAWTTLKSMIVRDLGVRLNGIVEILEWKLEGCFIEGFIKVTNVFAEEKA